MNSHDEYNIAKLYGLAKESVTDPAVKKLYLEDKKITQYISLDNLWKLGVDAKDHQHGREVYDMGRHNSFSTLANEFGYADASESALAFMFKTVGTPLTPILIRQFHYISTYKVYFPGNNGHEIYEQEEKDQGSIFRGGGGRCPVSTGLTKEGLEEMAHYNFFVSEIYDEKKKETIKLSSTTVDFFYKKISEERIYVLGGIDSEQNGAEHLKTLEYFIDEYKTKIKKAQSDDEKIFAIALLAKKIENAHFFSDGNLRTVRLVILKLLIENNLPLTCMNDPNIIDGHSSLEIVTAIKEGMSTYRLLKSNNDEDKKTQELSSDKIKQSIKNYVQHKGIVRWVFGTSAETKEVINMLCFPKEAELKNYSKDYNERLKKLKIIKDDQDRYHTAKQYVLKNLDRTFAKTLFKEIFTDNAEVIEAYKRHTTTSYLGKLFKR